MEEKKKGNRKDRRYVMIQTSPDEMVEYREASGKRGLAGKVAPWFRGLGKKDIEVLRKRDRGNA